DRLRAEVTSLRSFNAAQLLEEYPFDAAQELGYSPRSAEFMDRIQASALALNDAELAALEQHRFVISSRQQFPCRPQPRPNPTYACTCRWRGSCSVRRARAASAPP
ncbi:MAG: hypothetical protein ABI895_28840, partial [Deltaproteobacteria bacterium]